MKALAPIQMVSQAEALLAQAVERLARAETLVEIFAAGDVARVVREWLELRAKGSAAHASAWETVVIAQARAGQYTRRLPQGKRGPKSAVEVISPAGGENASAIVAGVEGFATKTEAIAALGITSQDVSRFERLAALPREELRARLDAGKQDILAGKRPREVSALTSGSDHDGDQFSTPPAFIAAARKVLGGIELDPMSNESAQHVVKAERYFTREQDAFKHEWRAKSWWFNPPYSRELIGRSVDKVLEELDLQHLAHNGICLTNCDPSTEWFRALLARSTARCEPKRIAFQLDGVPQKGNEHAQTLFYFGPKLPLFAKTFDEFGAISTVYRQQRTPRKGSA